MGFNKDNGRVNIEKSSMVLAHLGIKSFNFKEIWLDFKYLLIKINQFVELSLYSRILSLGLDNSLSREEGAILNWNGK